MTDLTNEWLQFLARHGAALSNEAPLQVLGFTVAQSESAASNDFVAPLTDLGLIEASGEEAARFLHSQLTNDVENLDSAGARLAGYCSPKGRLLATLLYWRRGDTILLQIPRQIQPAVQKRLQMFILRAKVKLRDVSDECVALGLAGNAAGEALTAWFPHLPPAPNAIQESAAGTLIRLADASDAPRFQWIAPLAVAIEAWPVLTRTLRAVAPAAWRLSQIRAGIPLVTQATQEQFVPQMINFELIGGVNFKKGCYPGQEIVARSQYLGKLKRRMLLATVADAQVRPGMEVFSAADPEQPCGMIVNAEASGTNQVDCLVEVKIAAADGNTVHVGTAHGAALQFMPLPYGFPDPA